MSTIKYISVTGGGKKFEGPGTGEKQMEEKKPTNSTISNEWTKIRK